MRNPDREAAKQHNLECYGLKIKKFRKACNMSAEELASRLNVTLGCIRNWECGLTRPDLDDLCRMIPVLKTTPNDFLGFHGEERVLTPGHLHLLRTYDALDPRGKKEYVTIGDTLVHVQQQCRLQEVRGKLRAVPDRGRYAAAGPGDDWSQQTEAADVLLYSTPLVSRADEIITVSGHSMEPAFHDRDRVLVQYCNEVRVGEVFVFSLRGLGCVIKEAAEDRLHSVNSAFADIVPDAEDGAELIGRVIGVIDPSMIPTEEDLNLYQEALKEAPDHAGQNFRQGPYDV